MKQIHFNQAEHLRITRVEQFENGRKYLMVHNRRPGETVYAPPNCIEVAAVDTRFASFNELGAEEKSFTKPGDKFMDEQRWHLVYKTKSGWKSKTCAESQGFTDSCNAHTMNYVLDLQELAARGIEILRIVSPDTDMSPAKDDDLYKDY